MGKLFDYLAVFGNIVAIGVGLYLIKMEHGLTSVETLQVMAIFFLLPVVNLAALNRGDDAETRKLKRELQKAELKKKLRELA